MYAEFKIKKNVENWVEIELANGYAGWVQTDAISVLDNRLLN